VDPWSSGGGFAVETGNNQASDGASVLTISIASSLQDCQAKVTPIPIKNTME
jgi:hypothetical protein